MTNYPAVIGDGAQDRAGPTESSIVDWSAARRMGRWLAGRKPVPANYRPGCVDDDFAELTARAEVLVTAATGLHPPTSARGRVIDRGGWIDANVASVQRLLGPTLARVEERKNNSSSGQLAAKMPKQLSGVGRTVSGGQFGLVLGWMSTKVLGQYDLLISEEASPDQDIVYYVGPNVVQLEEQYGFDRRQFRLWLALHEVTHRCQFTAVPWLRGHFLSLVDEGLEPLGSDPSRLLEGIKRAAGEIRAGRSPLTEVGMLGLVATPEQLVAIQRIQALMSLLEGHGDVTMDRAGAGEVAEAARFSRILHERRQNVRGPQKVLQQLLGLEAKMRQYQEGEQFVRTVEDTGGLELFNRVWDSPESLPTLTEIRNPADWVARVGDPAGARS